MQIFSALSPEELKKLKNKKNSRSGAEEDTFRSWEKYLFTECVSPESVVNFANLFWCYGAVSTGYLIPAVF